MKIMSIKFADDIIKEIINRGEISVKNNCVTGEEFEKWLRREKEVNGNTYLINEKKETTVKLRFLLIINGEYSSRNN